jgi:iron(II)-dependent oxidoreductase
MKSNRIGAVSAGLLCLVAAYPGSSWSQELSAGNDPSAGKLETAVEWVSVGGGEFTMGTNDGADLFKWSKPIHEDTIKNFEMSKTLVTVEQYAECVIKGPCTEPDPGSWGKYCNWGVAGRQHHPINCVDWTQANQFAKFKGARLPSESEYEYAAKSGGKNQKYPWGNEDATSDKAVMSGDSTQPVCSKDSKWNAKVSGGDLCDVVGNVFEWTADAWHDSYLGAPTDGSAWDGPSGSYRVLRGGSFFSTYAGHLRADYRGNDDPGLRYGFIGFRLARSSR